MLETLNASVDETLCTTSSSLDVTSAVEWQKVLPRLQPNDGLSALVSTPIV
jgi:hypothetical protein